MNARFFTILSGCLAVGCIVIAGDFWSQLATYFWKSETVVVTANALHSKLVKNQPMGEVTFQTIHGQPRTFSDHLSQKFEIGDVSAKTAAFIASYAPGTIHTAYIAPDGSRASLGHFPRAYSLVFGLCGIMHSIVFISGIFRWNAVPFALFERMKDNRLIEK